MAKITAEQLKSGRIAQAEMEDKSRKQIQHHLEFVAELNDIREVFNRTAQEALETIDAQAFINACAYRNQAIIALNCQLEDLYELATVETPQ